MATKAMNTISFADVAPKSKPVKTPNGFVTTRPGLLRKSAPTVIKSMLYDKENGEIRCVDMEGTLRRLKVARLGGMDKAKSKRLASVIWKSLAEAGKAKKPVVFMAAGGFNPDTWFCAIEAQDGSF
jgi:hypothetical protein